MVYPLFIFQSTIRDVNDRRKLRKNFFEYVSKTSFISRRLSRNSVFQGMLGTETGTAAQRSLEFLKSPFPITGKLSIKA